MNRDDKYVSWVQNQEGQSIRDIGFFLRMQDKATFETVEFYINKCRQLGSPEEHIKHCEGVLEKIREWQATNADKIKVPD